MKMFEIILQDSNVGLKFQDTPLVFVQQASIKRFFIPQEQLEGYFEGASYSGDFCVCFTTFKERMTKDYSQKLLPGCKDATTKDFYVEGEVD